MLFVLRFFQGIKATRANIELQNLIPQSRREVFSLKYKRFMILCLSLVAYTILSLAIPLGFGFFARYDSADSAQLAFRVMDILASFAFNLLFGYIFLCRPDETLKLWSANSGDLQGFGTLTEQDDDIFD